MLDVLMFYSRRCYGKGFQSFTILRFLQIWRNWRSSLSAFLQAGLEVLGKVTASHGPEMKNPYLFTDGRFCF